MRFLIHDLAVQNLEGVQVNALVERENGVADGGVVGQTEILLRRTRGRSGMTVPIGENFQTILTGVLQRRKLIFWREGEVLWRVIDILHPIVLSHHIAFV